MKQSKSSSQKNIYFIDIYKKIYFFIYSSGKKFDIDFIRDLFISKVQIETYIQHFNLTDPFESFSPTSSDYKNDVFARGTQLIKINFFI